MKASSVAIAVLLPLAVSGVVSAHHSFAPEFDASKPLKLTGTVTAIEWTNPHVSLYVDAKDEDGKVINWAFELRSPNVLIRAGWNRNSVQAGDIITVEGFRAKSGRPRGTAISVLLARSGLRLSAIDDQARAAR
jgi:hypothetical protein